MLARLKFTGVTVRVYPHHVNFRNVVVFRTYGPDYSEYPADELEFIEESSKS